jgi:hypothetical protein
MCYVITYENGKSKPCCNSLALILYMDSNVRLCRKNKLEEWRRRIAFPLNDRRVKT